MVRHHNSKVLSSGLPCKQGSNTIHIETALAHIVKLYWKPTKETNKQGYSRELFSTPRKLNVELNDDSLELLIRPTVKEELYISGPRLVIKGIENEDLTSTIVEQFPEGLLAFDELCTSSSIFHFNWLRTSTQKPHSYPLLKKKIGDQFSNFFARFMNQPTNNTSPLKLCIYISINQEFQLSTHMHHHHHHRNQQTHTYMHHHHQHHLRSSSHIGKQLKREFVTTLILASVINSTKKKERLFVITYLKDESIEEEP